MKSLFLVCAFSLLSNGGAFAAGAEGAAGSPAGFTKEQREKMAEAHEKMAACLRSEKTWEDCHDEMRKACKENMGMDACPMHGRGMMRHKGAPKK